MIILKVKLPEIVLENNKKIANYEKISAIFSFLHRNKGNEQYAILFPELTKGNNKNFGNILLIYFNNVEFGNKIKNYLFNNELAYMEYSKETINPNKYGVSIRKNIRKKTTPYHIKKIIEKYKNTNKTYTNEIDIMIIRLYKQNKNINEISQILKKEKNIYPYLIYSSQSLFKKGIYNSTIFEIDTILFDKEKKFDLNYFNNFGLFNQNFFDKNIALPII